MGKLLVIEGLDGSGKTTQTAILAEAMHDQGKKVRMVNFPDYKSQSSALVRMYLEGDFGTRPGDVNAYAASSFYAVDRFASFRKNWKGFYDEGGLVLADRYATSNAIHQTAKLPRDEWECFNDWLVDYEYNLLQIPQPDLVICLDVEPEVSQRLLLKRYGSEAKKDIHEKDVAYLVDCHKAAHWCAGRYGWQLLSCTKDGEIRPKDEIAQDIEKIANNMLGEDK